MAAHTDASHSPMTCNCQEYTSPSLTITKIGVALHVKFALKDNSYSYVDCDINIPTIPTSTPYDGGIQEAQEYLIKVRPVGWLEELHKFVDMSSAADSHHLIGVESWQVKMKRINRDIVLPLQVSSENKSLGFKSPPEPALPQCCHTPEPG